MKLITVVDTSTKKLDETVITGKLITMEKSY